MTSEQEDLTIYQLIRFLISCIEAGEKLNPKDYTLIERCKDNLRKQEQQLAQARTLLERYHALRFTAQHRTPDADVPDLWQLQQETRAFFDALDRKETSDGNL